MPRPYILGLNQPQIGLPALHPEPVGCAGHRLWQMVNSVAGTPVSEWMQHTQRVNLLSEPVLSRDYMGAARRRGEWLQGMVGGRTVILLGKDVADAMDHDYPPLVWAEGRDFVMIPHPSGKNLFYNNPVHREAVGILLADVLRGVTDATNI